MCFLSSPLPPLCCRFIPGPNRELTIAGLRARLFPSSTLSLPAERTKTITSTSTDWITWDHRKDIHPDKTALLAWCQGFETRLIPCLINEPHVGDSPLPHSCGQFPTYSLSPFPPPRHTLSPAQKLKQLSRGYLEVVKTLFEDIRPCLKVNRFRSLHGPEHMGSTELRGKRREITLISLCFCVEGYCVWLAAAAGRPLLVEKHWTFSDGDH